MSRHHPQTSCQDPRWVLTSKGQRCQYICDGNMRKFAPGSVCDEAEQRRLEEAQEKERLRKLGLDPSEVVEFTGGFGDLRFVGEYAAPKTRRIVRRAKRSRK